MFHDLNVNVAAEARSEAVTSLQKLGYDVIAFTTVISGKIKLTDDDIPVRRNYDSLKEERNTILHPDKTKRRRGLTVLERATLIIDDTSQLPMCSSPMLSKFDLVAIQPTTEKLFHQCLQFDFDILSLPFDKRPTFHLKRPHVNVLVEKGVYIEIPYAVALRDASGRRTLVSNASAIAATTAGKHLIVSSGATTPIHLRAPLDVVNLAVLFDIPPQHASASVVANPDTVVTHGDVRARMHKGIIRIEKHT